MFGVDWRTVIAVLVVLLILGWVMNGKFRRPVTGG
jgi:hypothetical protein